MNGHDRNPVFTTLRAAALGTTMLAASALAPAFAQAPNARPTGGQVVAGTASISQSTSTTTINQASQRAAVNWNSFNVGSQQSVQFNQPSTTSTTLNTVVGPDPSAIAGRISANGQIVIVNQAGVVFAQGAQVNAAALVVSAPGITTQNFMAGKMVFDQKPKPNAQVVNNGSITVAQAGLAALVAPTVVNNGTITAQLGKVVLAGAETHTVDLYGDKMLSINVTGQVTQAPVGPDGKTVAALVTNTGTIAAPGGTVVLTAQAVDGIVQNLVTAGGTVSAASAGAKTGKVVVSGVGGSVVVTGNVSATGTAAGTTGGQVALNASGGVTVASGARVDASGAAGGGTVAVGTTLARAKGGPSVTSKRTATKVTVAQGATITADATQSGNGGTVTLLSTQSTSMSGAITARGGPAGGNGGHVELSGDTGFALAGTVDVTARAPGGTVGTILIDPRDLYFNTVNPVVNESAAPDTNLTSSTPASSPGSLPDANTDAWVMPSALNGLSGAVTLAASRDILVQSAIDTTSSGITALEFDAGRNVTVTNSINTTGSLTLNATGVLTVSAPLTAGGSIALIDMNNGSIAGTGMSITAPVTAGTGQTISLSTSGAYRFATLSASGGTVEFGPSTGAAAASYTFGVGSGGAAITADTVRVGTTSLPGALIATDLTIGTSNNSGLNNFGAATLDVHATGTVTQYSGSSIQAGGLSGNVGSLLFDNTGNTFTTIGPLQASGDVTQGFGTLELVNSGPLGITGSLTGNAIYLSAVGSMTLSAPLLLTPQGSANPAVAVFTISPGTDSNSNFAQTGTSVVTQQGSGGSTVYVAITTQGSVTFNNLQAPSSTLLTSLDAGTASGQVNVSALEILGSAGGSNFTNTIVGGLTGEQAAAATFIAPAIDPAYLVNGFVAGQAIVPPIPPIPPIPPTPPTPPEPPAPPTPPVVVPPVVVPPSGPTQAEIQAAAVIANQIATTTPVVVGIANAVGAISGGTGAGDEAGGATASASGEQGGTPRADARAVPLINPLGDMSRSPLRGCTAQAGQSGGRACADPDLIVPNVSERDY